MSDIKLFQITDNTVVAIEGQSVAVEKSLQTLIEKHLEAFLGIRFLASEHTTGKTHGGRIEANSPNSMNTPLGKLIATSN